MEIILGPNVTCTTEQTINITVSLEIHPPKLSNLHIMERKINSQWHSWLSCKRSTANNHNSCFKFMHGFFQKVNC